MANVTLIPPEMWSAIRVASIRGVPDKDLADNFGVPLNTLIKRRTRDPEWAAACKLSQVTRKVTKPPVSAPDVVEKLISDNMDKIGQANATLVARFAHEATERAINGGLIPEPSSWQELAAANKLVRVNTGMDKEGQVNVQVGIWGGQYEAFDGPAVDI